MRNNFFSTILTSAIISFFVSSCNSDEDQTFQDMNLESELIRLRRSSESGQILSGSKFGTFRPFWDSDNGDTTDTEFEVTVSVTATWSQYTGSDGSASITCTGNKCSLTPTGELDVSWSEGSVSGGQNYTVYYDGRAYEGSASFSASKTGNPSVSFSVDLDSAD